VSTVYDYDLAEDPNEWWLAEPEPPARRPPQHRHRHARYRRRWGVRQGIVIGLLGALALSGGAYVVGSHGATRVRTTNTATPKPPPTEPTYPAVTVPPTTATTARGTAPITAAPTSTTTPAQRVYDAEGHVVPAGTPGAVPAGSGPPARMTVDGVSVGNPVMTNVPGVVYTAPAYYGAPTMAIISGNHPGVVDPEGRSVSSYLVAMHLPAGTPVAVVGSVVVGYVPPGEPAVLPVASSPVQHVSGPYQRTTPVTAARAALPR
jgi:hypothetical protein